MGKRRALDEVEVATRVEVVLRHPGVMLQTLTGSPPAQWVQGPAGRPRGKEPGLPPGPLKRAGPVSLHRHSPKQSHDQKKLESTLKSQGFKQGKVTHGRARLQGKGTLLPAVHFLEQAFAGADFSTEKFSAALS